MIDEPEEFDLTPVPWSRTLGVVARDLVRSGASVDDEFPMVFVALTRAIA